MKIQSPWYMLFLIISFSKSKLLVAQMFIGCVVGAIMYFGVVKQSKSSPMQGYLVGYGIFIPLVVWYCSFIVESLDVRTPTLRLALCSATMTLPLRCFQTMHGVLPEVYRESLWNYMLSIGFILRPRYDKAGQPIPFTAKKFGRGFLKYLYWMSVISVLCNFLAPFDFHTFQSNVDIQSRMFVFDLPSLYNTYIFLGKFVTFVSAVSRLCWSHILLSHVIITVLGNLSLALSMTGVSVLAGLLTGLEFNDHVTDFPLFFSTSHSEFWGSRWNNLIHNDLKQGVYKPIRAWTGNRALASVATFVLSGIQHEHVWWMIFTPTTAQLQEAGEDPDCCLTCFCSLWFGRQLFMFSYAGLWMAIEYRIGELPKFKSTTLQLLESHVFMMSLFMPVAHHFTADLVDDGYFTSLQHVLPILLVRRI